MLKENFTLRVMNRKEVDFAIEWAAAEGWNPGLHDADSFYTADSEGFLVGCVGDEPVACISAVRYGKTFAFVGFFLVKPEYRGNLYGYYLGKACLERLEGRTIGIDGVSAKLGNYKTAGFNMAFRSFRFMGTGGMQVQPCPQIVPLSTIPFGKVNDYDKPFFPDDRKRFLKSWIRQTGSRAFGFMDNGKLEGYGVIRPCREGFKIGPLFADSPKIAEKLFNALIADVPKDVQYFLDIPDVNSEAITLAKYYDMNPVFETARMYKGSMPELPMNRIFGITSFELG